MLDDRDAGAEQLDVGRPADVVACQAVRTAEAALRDFCGRWETMRSGDGVKVVLLAEIDDDPPRGPRFAS